MLYVCLSGACACFHTVQGTCKDTIRIPQYDNPSLSSSHLPACTVSARHLKLALVLEEEEVEGKGKDDLPRQSRTGNVFPSHRKGVKVLFHPTAPRPRSKCSMVSWDRC